jgi:acyl carrier protein
MSSELYFKILSEELMTGTLDVKPDMEFRLIPTWSSLNALLLVSRLNEEFNVLISASELAQLVTIHDLFELIELKRNG